MTEPALGPEARNGLDEKPESSPRNFIDECRAMAKDRKLPLVDHFAHWTKAEAEGTKIADWTTDQCTPIPRPSRHGDLMLPVVLKAIREKRQ